MSRIAGGEAVMLAENEQRRNLTPAERQRAVVALRDEFGWKMPAIAQRLGISESSAYRWAQGDDAASVRGGQPPSNPARTWGGRRGTRKRRIKADRVHAARRCSRRSRTCCRAGNPGPPCRRGRQSHDRPA
ncbi:MAG: hypothetical protein GEV09_13165 [Pseudonocardiaceae bacterium]|nr:hypothetical protein [Pseudonocardiaceae bacterium]